MRLSFATVVVLLNVVASVRGQLSAAEQTALRDLLQSGCGIPEGDTWSVAGVATACNPPWEGLTCAGTSGPITGLSFNCYVHFPVPASISGLSGLLSLELTRFGSGFPPIRALTQLRTLVLRDGQYRAAVPAWISELTQLSKLELIRCVITGNLPAELGQLSALRSLKINSYTHTDSWPSSFTSLNLEHLILEEIIAPSLFPAWISSQTNLKSLSLAGVRSEQSPFPDTAFWNSLTALTDLSIQELSFAEGSTIPAALFSKTTLRTLYLSDLTGLSGPLPPLIIPQLREFTFSYCEGVLQPPNAAGCPQLTSLDISINYMQGPFPSWITSLTQLEFIALQDNDFVGPLPSLATLPRLRTFDVSNTPFDGPLPDITGLVNLTRLHLRRSGVSGTIPASYTNLESFTVGGPSVEIDGLMPGPWPRVTRIDVSGFVTGCWVDPAPLTRCTLPGSMCVCSSSICPLPRCPTCIDNACPRSSAPPTGTTPPANAPRSSAPPTGTTPPANAPRSSAAPAGATPFGSTSPALPTGTTPSRTTPIFSGSAPRQVVTALFCAAAVLHVVLAISS